MAGGRAIYRGKITRAAAEARIAGIWRPYHAQLAQELELLHRAFGRAILIDLHSMPQEALDGFGRARPDIVLGDRFGAAADGAIARAVQMAFEAEGFRVVRNKPFAGAYIVTRYGRPHQGYHAIQIEVNRSLYMDEAAILPLPDFDAFAARMLRAFGRICDLGAQDLRLAAE